MMQILSFDVGGSKIAQALVDENGNLLNEVIIKKTPQSAEEIENIFKKASADNRFDGFALATAGVVFENKITGKPNNLPQGYECIDFANIFNVPHVIENDANSALWAEFKIGNLRGVKHGIMLTLGTDVGCGIISNGAILHGKCGAAGEVSFDCSGRSLRKITAELGVTETDCFKIHNMAINNNDIARKAYNIWQENLLQAVRLLNSVFDTEIIVLSGSLAKIVDYAKINASIKLLQPHNYPSIKPARCSTHAGVIGAALLLAHKMKG